MATTLKAMLGEISEDTARIMVQEFNAGEDSKSVWFSLERMEQLVTMLKTEKIMGIGTDGVRIYFGRYTEDTAPVVDDVNRNTVIFVSTREVTDADGTKFHEDYFDGIELSDTTIENLTKAANERNDVELQGKTNAENRGELCRPQCKGLKL